MKRLGLIRVLTTEDSALLNLHGRQIEKLYPGLRVVSRCIPDHPTGVHDDETHRSAIPHVVALAHEFRDEGYDAVVVSCAGDPGVEEARRDMDIPVIGAGRSAAALALALGFRVGVLGIRDEVPQAVAESLGGALVASAHPDGVATTLDLLTEAGRASAVRSGLWLKEQGVQVIALACTGLSTIGAATAIAAATGVRVIDPVIAEGLFAHYAVNS